MQQIADWLEKLGMSEYAQRFAENEIDVSVLRHLTDQDLKEIGVVARASAKDAARRLPSLPVPSKHRRSLRSTEPKPQDTAERRQVTVMFSDLVGSTALSARMDPEDLREVISAYQKCVAETVQRFGGFVAKYMGDGVLVYFGYPQAHEDDAERAVRAGLELIASGGRAEVQCSTANPRGHCHRVGRSRRSDRIGRGAGAGGSSARRRTLRHACRALPSRTRSSSPRARESSSAICSSLQDLGAQGPQGHRRAGAGLGGAAAELQWKAASRRCTRAD